MRVAFAIIFTLCAALLAPTPARAAPPQDYTLGSGMVAETLTHIGETEISAADGRPMALCLKRRHIRLSALPIWTKAQGYALSAAGCQSDSFLWLSDREFAAAQSMGLIPRDLPLTPRLDLSETLRGAWGLGVLLGGMAALGLLLIVTRRRRSKSQVTALADPGPVEHI